MATSLECCVCGGGAGRWMQHWNRDDDYGICAGCVADLRARGTSEAEIKDYYGIEGVNFEPPRIASDNHDSDR